MRPATELPFKLLPYGTLILWSGADINTRISLLSGAGVSKHDKISIPIAFVNWKTVPPTPDVRRMVLDMRVFALKRNWSLISIGVLFKILYLGAGFALARGRSTSVVRHMLALIYLSYSLSLFSAATILPPQSRLAVLFLDMLFYAIGTACVMWLCLVIAKRYLATWLARTAIFLGAASIMIALLADTADKYEKVFVGCPIIDYQRFADATLIASSVPNLIGLALLLYIAWRARDKQRQLALILVALLACLNIYGDIRLSALIVTRVLSLPNAVVLPTSLANASLFVALAVAVLLPYILVRHKLLRISWETLKSALLYDLKIATLSVILGIGADLLKQFVFGPPLFEPTALVGSACLAIILTEIDPLTERLRRRRVR